MSDYVGHLTPFYHPPVVHLNDFYDGLDEAYIDTGWNQYTTTWEYDFSDYIWNVSGSWYLADVHVSITEFEFGSNSNIVMTVDWSTAGPSGGQIEFRFAADRSPSYTTITTTVPPAWDASATSGTITHTFPAAVLPPLRQYYQVSLYAMKHGTIPFSSTFLELFLKRDGINIPLKLAYSVTPSAYQISGDLYILDRLYSPDGESGHIFPQADITAVSTLSLINIGSGTPVLESESVSNLRIGTNPYGLASSVNSYETSDNRFISRIIDDRHFISVDNKDDNNLLVRLWNISTDLTQLNVVDSLTIAKIETESNNVVRITNLESNPNDAFCIIDNDGGIEGEYKAVIFSATTTSLTVADTYMFPASSISSPVIKLTDTGVAVYDVIFINPYNIVNLDISSSSITGHTVDSSFNISSINGFVGGISNFGATDMIVGGMGGSYPPHAVTASDASSAISMDMFDIVTGDYPQYLSIRTSMPSVEDIGFGILNYELMPNPDLSYTGGLFCNYNNEFYGGDYFFENFPQTYSAYNAYKGVSGKYSFCVYDFDISGVTDPVLIFYTFVVPPYNDSSPLRFNQRDDGAGTAQGSPRVAYTPNMGGGSNRITSWGAW